MYYIPVDIESGTMRPATKEEYDKWIYHIASIMPNIPNSQQLLVGSAGEIDRNDDLFDMFLTPSNYTSITDVWDDVIDTL